MSFSPETRSSILHLLNDSTGSQHSAISFRPTGGGSINQTFKIITDTGSSFFLKWNEDAALNGLFEKERSGLDYLRKQKCIAIPEVLANGETGKGQYLLMEWIQQGTRSPGFWENFGRQLAALHKTTETGFGFKENNFMGSLPQENRFSKNWTAFFIHYRLEPQVKMAQEKKLLGETESTQFSRLYKKLDSIFSNEPPSLLHGDLWSGNFLCNENALPVLIDPAVYYGNRNADLAMTTLFGGFDSRFYGSYHHHFPLDPNYREQWDTCNLYPLLIHLNLFGSAYLHDIHAILKKYS